jgi:hypothetical protein
VQRDITYVCDSKSVQRVHNFPGFYRVWGKKLEKSCAYPRFDAESRTVLMQNAKNGSGAISGGKCDLGQFFGDRAA